MYYFLYFKTISKHGKSTCNTRRETHLSEKAQVFTAEVGLHSAAVWTVTILPQLFQNILFF